MESPSLITAVIIVIAIVVIAWALRGPPLLVLGLLGAGAVWVLSKAEPGEALGALFGGAEGPPPKPPFELEDFEWADATLHSSPRGDQILQEICFFRRVAPGARRVVDGTAHVGVDTAVLAHSFPEARITAIERDPDVFKILERNLEEHGYADRVEALNMSSADYFAEAPPEADLVYFDPPWGGPGYEKTDDLPLMRSDNGKKKGVPLPRVVNAALEVAPVVVVKVPYNFDYRSFEMKVKGHVVGITRIKYLRSRFRQKRALFNLLEIRKTACRES